MEGSTLQAPSPGHSDCASQPAIHQVIRELLRREPDITLWLFNGNITYIYIYNGIYQDLIASNLNTMGIMGLPSGDSCNTAMEAIAHL